MRRRRAYGAKVLVGSEILTLFGEIFLALAGFTGIVAALGQRSEGKWRPIDVVRFRGLLEGSLAGLFFSVIPFGFYYFGVAERIIWSICSGFLAVYIVYALVKNVRKHRALRASSDPDFVPGVRRFLVVLAIPVVAILALNAAGLVFEQPFAAYLLALIVSLAGCCAMFVLLLRYVGTDA